MPTNSSSSSVYIPEIDFFINQILNINLLNINKKAVVIANGKECDNVLFYKTLSNASFVVVLDSAIKRVKQHNIKIDVIMGDFDKDFNVLEHYAISDKKILKIADQNTTDLEKALILLQNIGFKNIDVLWATGRRADHTITNLTCIVKFPNLNIRIIDDYSNIFLLPKDFKKNYKKDTALSLIPVGTVEGIYSKNLSYNLNNDTLTIGYRTGSSNSALSDGEVHITYSTGALLMMECWDL